jgi:hypothetical protein
MFARVSNDTQSGCVDVVPTAPNSHNSSDAIFNVKGDGHDNAN